MNLGAVVLCGGESRRMGRPKAWLPFGPELMLQRVVRLVGTVARPIVVVAAPGQDLPELPAGVSIVTRRDLWPRPTSKGWRRVSQHSPRRGRARLRNGHRRPVSRAAVDHPSGQS